MIIGKNSSVPAAPSVFRCFGKSKIDKRGFIEWILDYLNRSENSLYNLTSVKSTFD